jgi:hypothetical protein
VIGIVKEFDRGRAGAGARKPEYKNLAGVGHIGIEFRAFLAQICRGAAAQKAKVVDYSWVGDIGKKGLL